MPLCCVLTKMRGVVQIKRIGKKGLMSTFYYSQYWANALTLRGSGGDIAALSRSIANARVDLNPHQIDAALFALRSPFTNGAVLADGKGERND